MANVLFDLEQESFRILYCVYVKQKKINMNSQVWENLIKFYDVLENV